MKNLTVGKKLLFGFGIVIALIALILAVTIVTSLQRDKQLEQIELLVELQNEAFVLQESFLRGRIELRTVYTASDESSLESYRLAMSNIKDSKKNLDNIAEIISRMDKTKQEKYGGICAQLTAMFMQIEDNLVEINSNDVVVIDYVNTISAAFDDMAFNVGNMYELADGAISGMILAEDYNAQSTEGYRANIVAPVEDILTCVSELRVQAAFLILNFDTSVVPQIHTMIDDVRDSVDGILSYITTDGGRAGAQAILDAVDICEDAVDVMQSMSDRSDELIEITRAFTVDVDGVISNGVVVINGDISSEIDDIVTASRGSMFLQIAVVAIAVLISILVALTLTKTITGPLNQMKNVLLQVGETGKMEFDPQVMDSLRKAGKGRDEIGQSINAFLITIDHLEDVSRCLTEVAGGDMTANVHVLSEDDTMGNAIVAMTDSLNRMFQEINNVATQVTTASQEIAHGAQTLAQGSTEQAATVEEISASVNEISTQMSESAKTSNDSAQQGLQIRQMAQEGSEKMEQMMAATKDINDASSAIEKVIKVIDDIAFQTNILALNAAVEAARAGQHGKGFAVVAEEVRNLAGKSADAAKETANLISANIEKAKLGLEISQDTSENLTRIIDAVNLTSESLQALALKSQQVTEATHQVTEAIDQVTHVVQQNSATSEQSAASSQEMNSQAQMLQALIKQFKLRDTNDFGYALPTASASAPAPEIDSYSSTSSSNKYGIDGMLM